jgi:uncharacterized protein
LAELEALFDKKCKCTICEHSFTSKKIRSRFVKLSHTDSDFCPTYYPPENNPVLYHILVCPNCGYSFSDDFSPYFPPNTKETIQERVSAHWVPQNFSEKRSVEDAIKTYKLSVYCASLKKEKHITIAGMYLRIAWLYRRNLNSEQEQRFMNLALREYIETYSTQDYQGTPVSEIRVLYLIGELYVRTGNLKESSKYFSKVIEQQTRTTEMRIVEMAKERWNEIRHNVEF